MNTELMLSPAEGGNMGEKDIRLKGYLGDATRYADLWNGSIFQGKQVVKAKDLEPISPVIDEADEKGTEEMLRDVVMKQSLAGQKYALWTVENQESIDYSMPARIMRQESMSYWEQVRRKKKENANASDENEKLRKGGEYLYKFKQSDKIYPMSTLVVYWGKGEWDGPKSLHDMIDWGPESEEIKKLVPEYPLHFLNLSDIEHPEYFKTELRPFFELYKYRDDKETFVDYLRNNNECEKMDSESWDVLGKVTNSPKLISKLKNKVEESKKEENKKEENKEEKGKVCRALQEFYNDGIAEGKAEGKASGIIELLSDLGEIPKELCDKIYMQKNLDILRDWLKLAAKVESIDDFINISEIDMEISENNVCN